MLVPQVEKKAENEKNYELIIFSFRQTTCLKV
jgi:hypothetical protein